MSSYRIRVRCSSRLILTLAIIARWLLRKSRETFGTKAEMRVSVELQIVAALRLLRHGDEPCQPTRRRRPQQQPRNSDSDQIKSLAVRELFSTLIDPRCKADRKETPHRPSPPSNFAIARSRGLRSASNVHDPHNRSILIARIERYIIREAMSYADRP
jgi:hypothetical protein